jgi:hypothetical protein
MAAENTTHHEVTTVGNKFGEHLVTAKCEAEYAHAHQPKSLLLRDFLLKPQHQWLSPSLKGCTIGI